MRIVIVEGKLDEVLAVLEKTYQSDGIDRVSLIADSADEHHGTGAGKHEPDKKDCSPIPSLSDRERSIVTHLMEGHSNKVIALDLSIAEATVKTYVKSILNKIGATNRTQAAMWGSTNLISTLGRATKYRDSRRDASPDFEMASKKSLLQQ